MLTLKRGPMARELESRHATSGSFYDADGNIWHWDERAQSDLYAEGFSCGLAFLPKSMVTIEEVQHYYVSAYLVTREYGGREEGGWWYDAGDLLETIECTDEDFEAKKAELQAKYEHLDCGRPLHSVLNTGSLNIRSSDQPGASYPTARPHYC